MAFAGVVSIAAVVVGCAGSPRRIRASSESTAIESGQDDSRSSKRSVEIFTLDDGAREFASGDYPAALVQFSSVLRRVELSVTDRVQAFRGVAETHEKLGDFASASASWSRLAKFAGAVEEPSALQYRREAWMRAAACQAELEAWEESAALYLRAAEIGGGRLAERIEAEVRRAYAYYQLDVLDTAEQILVDAEPMLQRAQQEERLSEYFFVGMARFYRAAVIHRRFREVPIRLPEARMADDFEKKLALLIAAQEAYNDTIRAKHVYWVSAAGLQLGSLFEEFYDALMNAPVPEWLSEAQRREYYEALKLQLRPVVNKAIWVFEKNLQTATRLGYDNHFVEETEGKLARLQGVLLSGDTAIGEPTARLSSPAGDRAAIEPASPWGRSRTDTADTSRFIPTQTPL